MKNARYPQDTHPQDKLRYMIFVYILLFTFIFSACSGSTPTPLVVVVTATDSPPTEVATALPVSTLAPVALSGPQSGAAMKWMDGSTLIYIPAGDFTMGDGINALSHNVTLDGYWIQQTKVTNRMYEQCLKVGACTTPSQELGGAVFSNPEFGNHPVVGITWDQAQSYCTWTQGSLPTEAQWEKAARGTNGNTYPWGNTDPACSLLNFSNCYESTNGVDAFLSTGASSYGLLDMAGNAFEWASDWYSESYYATSPLANPLGPESGQYRVVRGSSFETDDSQIASAIRRFNEPGDSERDTGFRCAVPNPQPIAPYCQLSAFVPANTNVSTSCTLPEGVVTDQYCQQGETYATVQLSFGSTWEPRGTRLICTEATGSGIRQLTCSGPETIESTNEIVVCNESCSNKLVVEGVAPSCPSGYTLEAATGLCNYTPILNQVGVSGCPVGYSLMERGGQQTCAIGKDVNGYCPAGTYFDDLAGMCVPPNGETSAPYGIDDASLAVQTYAGCATGYDYNENFQCCQAVTGGTYPGCGPGTSFNADVQACIPTGTELSGAGCITVRVNTLKCSEPVNTCAQYSDSESRCVANFCTWNEKATVCEMNAP
ncbi:MAG: SUMF1/EgtB/PvdO family nonheme iron enzyme [Anaerolineales bacterium]|nr:SUMF1/EgtB/PvdO family nonheme iron enzyme [Anaerolineales bacterium]